ncbi:uncharacterized protein LOC121946420 [Plectropomus leopardus]|uniref:uncharacterized protein LOC121946420 n=1 Tax=Plectropomus leopardus TaxID=160734 RepID=UPI001C4B0605|nr:uncharacterized protein LOC121946420 [Plectropomus leopardus]
MKTTYSFSVRQAPDGQFKYEHDGAFLQEQQVRQMLITLQLEIEFDKGQQRIEEFEHVLLRLAFPSFYNSYNKSCCKLYPGGCYKLLDSAGFTCDLLKGRVTKTEKDGWIEFKISNVRFVDGGYYRCIVLGTQNRIYSDYYVEVSEVSGHHRQSQPLLTTTIKAPNSSTTLPDSTGPHLAQDHSDSPRVPWSFGLPLAVIVSLTVMILVTSVIGVVCCRVKAKCKQPDKYGETLCESQKQEAPETSGIVYTTVDFRAHQKLTEVYANLRVHNTQTAAPDSTWNAEHDGMVEYSTLAIHQ